MDRGKNIPPKGSKSKPLGFSGDFIALGPSKAARPEAGEGNKPGGSKPVASSAVSVGSASKTAPSMPTLGSDKKREATIPLAAASSQLPKKPKPGQTSTSFAALGRPGSKLIDPPSPGAGAFVQEAWEGVAIEVEPTELLSAISEADNADDEIKIEALLCGAVKALKAAVSQQVQRNKVEPTLALALVYLAKWRPQYFNTELIVEALLSLLRRDSTPVAVGSFKGRTASAATASLACNLLLAGFQEDRNWSESFLKVFVEDSVGDRIWVDREECQGFVENILTAFNTKLPSRNILQPQEGSFPSGPAAAASPNLAAVPGGGGGVSGLEDEASVDSDNSQGGMLRGLSHPEQQQVQVIPRFAEAKDIAEALVMDVVNQHLSRRQQPASDLITRNFLKFLASTAGLPGVRLQAAQRLEMWLSNQKLLKPATDLLLAVCINCNAEAPTDADVINALLRLRLKSKQLLQIYLACFKELVEQQSDQLPIIIRLLIFNELSPSRGPNNMAVLAILVQPWPDRAAAILADVFIELLLNREDYLRALRALLREVVRALRHDLPLPTFCAALLQASFQERRCTLIREFEFKERLMSSLADLATLCLFLTVNPAVRESAVLVGRGELREVELFRQFHQAASAIQREAVLWLYAAVPVVFEPTRPVEFVHCLRKVLFMESGEHYYNKDGWPPEVDRAIMIRLASEIPVLEDTLRHVLLMGLSKEYPISAPDSLELVDQLLRRCAAAAAASSSVGHGLHHLHQQMLGQSFPPPNILAAEGRDFFDLVLRLTAYHYPENILLPQGYHPPSLAISTLYWKGWLMLLILTAHNPVSLGAEAWAGYPTLRCLMEMSITNDFSINPSAGSSVASALDQELQVAAVERQTILEFETHLAAASTKTVITESNSLLLSQLTSLDPRGPARRPPPAVIDQLRNLNGTLRLGHLLCRSRSPDFLLEILHRQGPAQSKPWLAELVESNEGAWNLLPVQCLCEFLLHEAAEEGGSASVSGVSFSSSYFPSLPALPSDLLLEEGHKLPGIKGQQRGGGGSSSSSNVTTGSAGGGNKERRHKHQQLVHHLRLLLMDPAQPADACREVLDYLMRRLSAQKSSARQQALAALSVVLNLKEEDGASEGLTHPDSGPPSAEELPSKLQQQPYWWLIHQLASIPHFEAVRPAVVAALRSAILVETQPQAVAAYLRFLATSALEEPLHDLADLSLDLAQVIVERSSLVAALLPSSTNRTTHAARTLECLLQLFWNYLRKAREPNKEAYTWSENQDQVLVQWSTGEAASLHILVVHAMIILLTYGPPEQAEPSCFGRLLEAWFPSSGELPQAFLVETSEEALLYPDWLKLRMIRSQVDILVDTALKELEPGQLILFIQSFGIPVASMSKLLSALDRMVQANAFAFVEVDMDKSYMQQLFQVQWARGARGGSHFADIMQFPAPCPDVSLAHCAASSASVYDVKPVIHRPPPPSQSIIGPLVPAVLTVEAAALALRQIFDIRTVIRLSQPEKVKAFRALSQALCSEFNSTTGRPSTETVAIALDGLLDPGSIAMLERQTAFSCGLLRLLTGTSTSGIGAVTSICQKIVHQAGPATGTRSPLTNIARQFLLRAQDASRPDGQCSQKTPAKESSSRLDLSSKWLERHVQQLAGRALATNDTRSLVDSTVSCLQSTRAHTKCSVKPDGLLVDWLELLDPEIVSAQPEAEMRFLFGKSTGPSAPPSCRPYALALLVHQASWTTLRKCIHQLLGCSGSDGNVQANGGTNPTEFYEPKVVLDFLAALIKVPKLWQGRDKHVPKHRQAEDLLRLTHQQLFRLAEYIISEYVQHLSNSQPIVAAGRPDLALGKLLEERCLLLLSCCGGSGRTEATLARHIADSISTPSTALDIRRRQATRQLLLHLYVRAPHVAVRLPSVFQESEIDEAGRVILQTASPCAMDPMALTLITSLACPQPGKEGGRRLADLESALRKMAATHPLLLLRQFPSLAASLRGRAHLDLIVLRSRNHLNLFSCTLGLAQQLAGHLLSSPFPEGPCWPALQDMLSCFWTLFGNQRLTKDSSLVGLLQRFLHFLLDFVAAAPFAAYGCLQEHVPLLQDLQLTHPDMTAIVELLSALSRPRPAADKDEDPHQRNNSGRPIGSSAPAPPVAIRSALRLSPILARLRQSDNCEEVIQVLQDLEGVVSRAPSSAVGLGLDSGAVSDLRPLLSSPNQTVRHMAYSLLLRHLKDRPQASSELLPDYLDCLDSRSAPVVTSALERLPDFLLLCQENGDVLLQKAFNLSVENGYNTLAHLTEAVMLLQLQTGT